MNDQFADLVAAARQWVEEGTAAEWVEAGSAERFAALERATPADLFVDAQARPLVVALFGGTGVGKSSLLNRLAGATVARVGVERPTSREITLYVHHDVKLADFPETLPLESVEVRRHGDDAHKNILWIDAPDIDSVEPQNRACALAWLPHIDLLVYVVSPERYRDDVGWRVLQDRSLRHGWLFVMNRWDEGDRAQRDDFARMMRTAGFDDPLVLCTSCLDGAELPSSDEFARIEAVINDLLAAHGVRELTRLGHRARLQELRATLQAAGAAAGQRATAGRRSRPQRRCTGSRPAMCCGMVWTGRSGISPRAWARGPTLRASRLPAARWDCCAKTSRVVRRTFPRCRTRRSLHT